MSIKNSVSVLLKFSLSQISVFRSQRHEQLLYALKSEKNKLKTHYKKWAVNKKILNQTYQLKALLYETLLQVPELKHPPLYTSHQEMSQTRGVCFAHLGA